MEMLASLLASLAVLALVIAGLAMIVGFRAARDRFFRYAAFAFVLSLLVQCVSRPIGNLVGATTHRAQDLGAALPIEAVLAVVLGHVVLAVVLIRRRLRGQEHARRVGQDRERARAPERVRLPPRNTEDGP